MISSASNATVKLVRSLQARRRARQTERLFVIEGVRLLEEMAKAGLAPRLVLHTEDLDARGQAAVQHLAGLGAPVHSVTPKIMSAMCDTRTPQGLLAVVPWEATQRPPPAELTFALVLDRVADPGNLGAILRTADAAGVQAVFLAPETVDAHNPKVVRAAMGAHFHVSIVEADWDELKTWLAGLDVWLAEAAEGEPYAAVNWRRPCALIIGSEADGPSQAAQRFTPRRVHIPMPGRAESLNAAVAAGVLMFEAARQRG